VTDIQDKEFFRTFVIVLAGLAVVAVVALILANVVVDEDIVVQKSPLYSAEAIAERIAPVGRVRLEGEPAPATATETQVAQKASAEPKSGSVVVQEACAACHQAGVLGAPVIGNKEAWDARYAQGMDILVDHAAKGYKGMPPQGAMYAEAELRAAIATMLQDSGIAAGPAPEAATAAAPAAEPVAQPVSEPAPATGEPVPAGESSMAEPSAAAPDLAKGEQVYSTFCIACHMVGVAGAPRLGDRHAWAPRIAKGMENLQTSATQGLGAMPPKGGCVGCTEDDIAATIAFMVSQSQ
jgi:cytochrome c5